MVNKKIAIITGASRGIGKTIAMGLAKSNYHVILISRSESHLQKLKAEIESEDQTADIYALDVSNYSKVEATIVDIVNRFHKIDFLFNNAGVWKSGTSDISVEHIDEVIKTNLLGVIYMGNCVAQQMKKQKNGYIINMSSMAGKRGLASSGIYCASKFGVLGYSESLYKELLAYGVKVTSICPSLVASDMSKSFSFDQELMIKPDDILKTVQYLLELEACAAIPEVIVQCSSFVVKEAQALTTQLTTAKTD